MLECYCCCAENKITWKKMFLQLAAMPPIDREWLKQRHRLIGLWIMKWYIFWVLNRCERRSNKEIIKHLATLDRFCQSIRPLPWQPPTNNICTGLYEGKRATICDNINIITVTNGRHFLLYSMRDQTRTLALRPPTHAVACRGVFKKSCFSHDTNDTSDFESAPINHSNFNAK